MQIDEGRPKEKRVKVYHYNPVTREYLTWTYADISPRDGVALLPAHATFEEPPVTETPLISAYIDGEWRAMENIIGKRYGRITCAI
jgi:hypothetical protein